MNKKNKNISSLASDKLLENIKFLKRDLFNLRFQQVVGELKDTSQFSKSRKDVARIKTELTKRKNGGA